MSMNDSDRTFFTATMAGIYAQQGNLARAAQIYRHLLRQSPQREDLRQALVETEARLAALDPYDIVERVGLWAELTLKLGRVSGLDRVCRRLRIRRHTADPETAAEEKP
jgi:hypothetical protein